jgi:hypothetical protein
MATLVPNGGHPANPQHMEAAIDSRDINFDTVYLPGRERPLILTKKVAQGNALVETVIKYLPRSKSVKQSGRLALVEF